jgi:TonB-dependent receptor
MRSRHLLLAGSAAICCAVAQPALAQTKIVNIDAQPVQSAIGVLSDQWDIQILAARRITQGKVANAVRGNLTVSDVLGRLLQGTGLFAKQTGPQTYTILPVEAAVPKPVALVETRAAPAFAAQSEPTLAPPQQQDEGQAGDIVVTGFRASLNEALSLKRRETAAIDSIIAEDIGKFPDGNLAESMQRIPGVALGRGDGGEGRGISVRGLGSRFTRVRINGMEGTSQTSGSDIYGQFNSGRSFDFNTFPTEIFSALSVRKTPSAETEEGSLGATVDLRAPKPFDQKGSFVFSGTARGIYNQLSKEVDPRLSALVSKKFGDTFGILASVAYTQRDLQEYGYQSGNVLPSYVSGLAQTVPTAPGAATTSSVIFPYCTPIGYVYNGVPVNSPLPGYANGGNNVGASATHCSTNNPRTSTVEVYDKIMALTGPSGRPGGGAFIPRVPRPVNTHQDQERIAGTLTFQWKPTDDTDISIDGLYARFKVRRIDAFLSPQSMARTAGNNGQPMMSVKDIEFDELGTMTYGLWDGVDLRSDVQDEHFTSTFRQVNLNFDHRFSDAFRIYGLAGASDSKLKVDKVTMGIDAIDTDDFSVDFREGGDIPIIKYGIDISNPDNFAYQAPLADGTQLGTLLGFKRNNIIKNKTFELNGEWALDDAFTVVVGGQHRTSDFTAETWNVAPPYSVPAALPAGTTVRDLSYQITGNDRVMKDYPSSWVGLDPDKWKAAVGYKDFPQCGVECGSYFATVDETYDSGFLMVRFTTEDMLPFTLRGDAGVRYVRTKLDTTGLVPVAAPAGSPYPTAGAIGRVKRSYDDWLPSMNLVLDVTRNLLLRGSAARVMSRPNYLSMVPAGNVSGNTREGSFGNPFLDPARANTFDIAGEWYFAPGSLFSVAYFNKNLETYVQSVSSFVPFNTLGLPDSVLANTTASPTENFTITRSENTPGGSLKGVEVNLQLPFRFLPGILRNFGLLANYTHVSSRIDYVLQSANGIATLTTNERLVDLSPDTVSATLYYEDDRFSIRSTANYRSAYLTNVPSGGNDSDVRGILGATFVDASASYKINDNLRVIAEVQNITNARNRLYIDSKRKDPLHTTYFGRTYALAVNIAL